MTAGLRCRTSDRRARVRRAERLTGVDFVDYARDPAPTLTVHLLGPLPPDVSERSFLIEGGRRVTDVRVLRATPGTDDEGEAAVALALDREGDASTYTVRLVRDRDRDRSLPDGVDPRYDRADFGFKLDCPADIDCVAPPPACDEAPGDGPALDYLSKDFASFRQLLFDRLALTLPDWKERHVPDVGVALVELMAYVGDRLSYQQDAVATEAYLDTARLRTSVRRHARLIDYRLHDGCNARAWVTVCADQDVTLKTRDVAFATASGERFLPVTDAAEIRVRAALGRIPFYTWGDDACCLPRGATRATLELPRAAEPTVAPGDVLLFEEVLGPITGAPEDADPTRRHPVRLVAVAPTRDPLARREDVALYDIEWAPEDALPFPLCLSSLAPARGCASIRDVSVARGNVVLVDHGAWVEEDLGARDADAPTIVCEDVGRPALQEPRARPYRPVLGTTPLTSRAPLPRWTTCDAAGRVAAAPPPASVMLRQDPREALPVVALASTPRGAEGRPARCRACGALLPSEGVAGSCRACGAAHERRTWTPRVDLLASSEDDAHFVVESDDEGVSHLRFGDGVNGRAPSPGEGLRARYRVGNGPAGNVAAEAITVLSLAEGGGGLRARVRNPLPATGGVAPEPVDDARAMAPEGLRARRERAVIAEDYAELARRDRPSLQRAAAELRWTGSWYEARVALDPAGSTETPPPLRWDVARGLERYRRIGHDLRVEGARYAPVDLAMTVCARPEQLRAHVRRAVREALAGRGFFAPDRFSFGQPVTLAEVAAAVHAVPGVLAVEVTRLARVSEGDRGEVDDGELRVGPMEIARLDDDPARPEDGVLEITMRGGR